MFIKVTDWIPCLMYFMVYNHATHACCRKKGNMNIIDPSINALWSHLLDYSLKLTLCISLWPKPLQIRQAFPKEDCQSWLAMYFDEYLQKYVGVIGKWQIFVLCIIGQESIFMSFSTLSPVFIAYAPQHWCKTALSAVESCSQEDILKLSVPCKGSCNVTLSDFDGCSFYNRDYSLVDNTTCEPLETVKFFKWAKYYAVWNLWLRSFWPYHSCVWGKKSFDTF